jgi:hypothetical protein
MSFGNLAAVCFRPCDRNIEKPWARLCVCVCVRARARLESRCSVGCWLLARLFAFTHVVSVYFRFI